MNVLRKACDEKFYILLKITQNLLSYCVEEGMEIRTTVRCRWRPYCTSHCTGSLQYCIQYSPSTRESEIENVNEASVDIMFDNGDFWSARASTWKPNTTVGKRRLQGFFENPNKNLSTRTDSMAKPGTTGLNEPKIAVLRYCTQFYNIDKQSLMKESGKADTRATFKKRPQPRSWVDAQLVDLNSNSVRKPFRKCV